MAEGVKVTSEEMQTAAVNMQAAANKIGDSSNRVRQITADTRSRGFTSDQASPAYEAAVSKVIQKMSVQNEALKKLKQALDTTRDELGKTDSNLKTQVTNIEQRLGG